MKNFIKRFCAGAIIPAAVTSTLFSHNISPTKGIEPKKLNRPYVVEVIDAEGSQTAEFKGTSSEIDPYLISKKLDANPFAEDKFSAFPSIDMGIGSKITLYRAPDYEIVDGKKTSQVRSWAKTVGQLLKEKNVELGQDDKINFSADTQLEESMEIKINRVAKTTVIEKENISYNITKKNNPNLEKGTKNILQAGSNGIKNKYYLVTREDGVEVSRVLQKTEVAVAPIDEIDEIGTKVVVYGSGKATWYVNSGAMIGACNLVPKGTKLHVVNTANGKSVDITTSGGGDMSGIIDLSTTAFQALGASTSQGTIASVRLEKYYSGN